MTDFRQVSDNDGHVVQALGIKSTEAVDGSVSTTNSTTVTETSIMRVVSTSNINIDIGTSPTATTSTALLPAGVVEYFKLNPTEKIAVLGGVANISTME